MVAQSDNMKKAQKTRLGKKEKKKLLVILKDAGLGEESLPLELLGQGFNSGIFLPPFFF